VREKTEKLPPIVSAQGLSKRYGVAPLFQNISFTVSEGDRIGVIGPNGSGKSTLLEIAYRQRPAGQRGTWRFARDASQLRRAEISEFAPGVTIRSVIEKALERLAVSDAERASRYCGNAGPRGLCGSGCRRRDAFGRLAASGSRLAEALVAGAGYFASWTSPPTIWISRAFNGSNRFCGTRRSRAWWVSHDRYFLENVANEMVELNRAYDGGALRVGGNYSAVSGGERGAPACAKKQQESLANRVHTEDSNGCAAGSKGASQPRPRRASIRLTR